MKTVNATLAAVFAGVALCSAAASAATITFSGLSGGNGSPVASYSESGFMLTTTFGRFFEEQVFGNPAPNLVAGSAFGGLEFKGLIIIGSGSVNFESFDLATNNGDVLYSLSGFLGDVLQYAFPAVEFMHTGIFNTILNPDAAIPVDEVDLFLDILGTSIGIDNIVVNPAAAIPEPAGFALLGSALAGMGV